MTNITVYFGSSRDGGVMTRHQGKVSFPARGGVQPQVGDEYEVVAATPNARGTVYFLKLGRRISTAAEREAQAAAERQAQLAEAAARRQAETLAAQNQREAAIAASLAPWQGAGLEDERFVLQGGDQGAILVYLPDEDELTPQWFCPLQGKTIDQAQAWKSQVIRLRELLDGIAEDFPDASRDQVKKAATSASSATTMTIIPDYSRLPSFEEVRQAIAWRLAFDRRLVEQDAAIERLIGLGWHVSRSAVLNDHALKVDTPPPAHRLICRERWVLSQEESSISENLIGGEVRVRDVRAILSDEKLPDEWSELFSSLPYEEVEAVYGLHARLLGIR